MDIRNNSDANKVLMGSYTENDNGLITVTALPSVYEQHIEPDWIDVYLTGTHLKILENIDVVNV
jgi:hypothetical protein